jgi:hypothetical protein
MKLKLVMFLALVVLTFSANKSYAQSSQSGTATIADCTVTY